MPRVDLASLAVARLGMLRSAMLDTDLQRRVQRLLSGDRRTEDLDRIFLSVRGRDQGRASLREIGDFVAHRDQREKGQVTARVRDMFLSCRSWSRQQMGIAPTLEQACEVAAANLRTATDVQLEANFKLKRSVVKSVLQQAIKKISKGKRLTDREYRIFNYLGTAFIWNNVFTDEQVTDDLAFVLRERGLLTKADQEQFKELTPFLSLYIIALMHGSAVLLDDGSRVELLAGFGNKERRLEIKAVLHFSDMPKPIFAPICVFWTGLLGTEHCAPELLADFEWWTGPLDVDRAGKLTKL
jgi:hypothetical protein